MPTNGPPSGPSPEERIEVERTMRAAADILSPAVRGLREQGYNVEYTANEEEDVITMRVVVHTKWPTT